LPTPTPEDLPQPARAPTEGILVSCPACGAPLKEGQKACSGKCRATLSRQRKEQAVAERDATIQAHAEAILRLLGDQTNA
jgi:predicted nucleic acid-binding Zn ribbon protein